MKKFLLFTALSSLAFSAPYKAQAEETEHYQSITIKSSAQAFELLDQNTAKIEGILEKQDELEFLELEAIHEITYTLEASVDKLRADNTGGTSSIDALDEAIQAIHFSSENQEEAIVRTWFPKLKQATLDVKETTESADPKKQESYIITIKDHVFFPTEITVPAGEKIKLIIDNQDPTPEEFESHDLNREKIISGYKKATIFIGPLKPGKYHFFGEFNIKSANGYIIAE